MYDGRFDVCSAVQCGVCNVAHVLECFLFLLLCTSVISCVLYDVAACESDTVMSKVENGNSYCSVAKN